MKLLIQHSTAFEFAPILTQMINLIVKNSDFARMHPLHHKGDKSESYNYRPYQFWLPPQRSLKKFWLFLEANNIFCNSQNGFREKGSTASSISKLMEHLYSNFDESKITQGVFFIFQRGLWYNWSWDFNEKSSLLYFYQWRLSFSEIAS